MKYSFCLIFALFIVCILPAQITQTGGLRPAKINTVAVNNANLKVVTTEERLTKLEADFKSLMNDLAVLKKENITLKAELEKNKTALIANFKVLDYSFGQMKKTFDNHVHPLGNVRISGFISSKLEGVAQPVRIVTASNSTETVYCGKPAEGKE